MNQSERSLSSVSAQQFCPCIVLSVQLATEFTSFAAPRTVLHAASAKAVPINTMVVTFCNISDLLI